jgi:molecular chaperone Hsp33
MEDHIVRATAANGMVRAFAAITKEMVQDAHITHGTSGIASAALGRTLTAAAMMSRMFKNENDVLTIQIKGNGPLGGIVVVSDSQSNVKGYVYNPQVYLPLTATGKYDVAGAVGKPGYLNVIKDLGLREPYVGYVDLVSGEIAEDIAYYFAYSEQIPTVVSLGVLVGSDENIITAGGYMLQLMPGADEDLIEYLEDKVMMTDSITCMLTDGLGPSEILEKLLGEKGLEMNDTLPCKYQCDCCRERMERGLVTLGAKELVEMADEQHGAELVCHFCNKKYYFTEEELRSLV